jgi:hypothetical protein
MISLLRMAHSGSISPFSYIPSTTWRGIFDRERSMPRDTLWCEASIDSAFLVIICSPEELETYHFAYLKEDVETANEKFNFSVAQQEEASARFRQSQEERKKTLRRGPC